MRVDKLWLVPASGQEVPIDIEVAEDPQEKAMGLMFRTELADNQGMLFPYSEARELSMWMRNTYIPLDMLFIRPDGVIHRIEARAEPMSERIINSRRRGVGRAGACPAAPPSASASRPATGCAIRCSAPPSPDPHAASAPFDTPRLLGGWHRVERVNVARPGRSSAW